MKTNELQQTIADAKSGDAAAMSKLYDAYYDRIANYALRRVLDQHIAEDITSNVFIKVLDNLPRFTWRHEHSFSGWIFRIASNELNQYFRKQARYEMTPPSDMDDVYALVGEHRHETSTAIEQQIDTHKDFIQLHGCINKLKPKHQDIIHLFYFEKLTHREIAGALGMREGSVRVTLHRATSQLKNIINANSALSTSVLLH